MDAEGKYSIKKRLESRINPNLFMKSFLVTHFMQSAFNLSNGVTDLLESSSILIYLIPVKGFSYTKGHID
jgi:hypothetical protein